MLLSHRKLQLVTMLLNATLSISQKHFFLTRDWTALGCAIAHATENQVRKLLFKSSYFTEDGVNAFEKEAAVMYASNNCGAFWQSSRTL